jgi:fatty acid desaturase
MEASTMTSRLTAWMVFLGCIGALALGVGSGAQPILRAGVWGFWLLMAALFVWAYARAPSSADRMHLIDSRGINLLPCSLRRWLFGN